jgi:hypothetical protein
MAILSNTVVGLHNLYTWSSIKWVKDLPLNTYQLQDRSSESYTSVTANTETLVPSFKPFHAMNEISRSQTYSTFALSVLLTITVIQILLRPLLWQCNLFVAIH